MSSPLRAYRPVCGTPFRIGRSTDCDLTLHDPAVSRLHATVAFDSGNWFFENHSNTTGSWCGEECITRRLLQDGDILQLGVQQLRFLLHGEELTLLYIADNGSSPPCPLEKGARLRLGRAPGSELLMEHPLCPSFLGEAREREGGCEIRLRRPARDEQGKRRRIARLDAGEWLDLPWGTLEHTPSGMVLRPRRTGFSVTIEDLEVHAGKRPLLSDISLDLKPGSMLCVIGLSGQGKTTLLKALASAHAPGQGSICFDGRPHHAQDLQSRVALLPQHPLLRDFMTVSETLFDAAKLRLPSDHTKEEVEARIGGLLSLSALEHRASTRVAVLSGGERRRLALAVQLMGAPGLLLLDEPLAGLDPVNAAKLCSHLRQLAWLGHTVILTTHSFAALDISDHVLVLHEGRQAFFGNKAEAFAFFGSSGAEQLLARLPHKSGEEWASLYKRSRVHLTRLATRVQPNTAPARALYPSAPRPLALGRFLRLEIRSFLRDRGRLAALLGQPLLIGLLLRQVFTPGTSLWAASFALLLCANWFSLSLSIRAIVAERALLADELRAPGRIASLLSARAFFPVLTAMIQSLGCWLLFGPPLGVSPAPHLLVAALAMAVLPGVATGIAASALSRSAGQANALLPLLLIPQAALAGALAPLDQMSPPGRLLAELMWSSHAQTLLQNLLTHSPLPMKAFVIPSLLALGIFIIDALLLARLRKNT